MSGKRPYSERLKDGRWQKLKNEVCGSANWRCEDCGRKADDGHCLQVHHVFYLSLTEPWDHPPSLLRCCCERCHVRRQKIEQAIFRAVGEMLRDRTPEELMEFPIYYLFN